MALEATHIRFALDIKDKLDISDIKKYLSGTIYPDSRYVTGIDRNLTHPQDFLNDEFFKSNDFRKGWFVHLLCDKIQRNITVDKFPEVLTPEKVVTGNDAWIKHSALKILQDIDDVNKFNIVEYLSGLDYIETPNGEDIAKMKEYNRIFQKMYADPSKVDIKICCDMWKALGISDDLVAKIKERAEEYKQDEKIVKLVLEIYPEMIIKAKQ